MAVPVAGKKHTQHESAAWMVPERLEPRRLMSSGPTPAEQYMLELLNSARANPSAEAARDGIALNEGLAPDTISAASKQPLAFDPQLIDAARRHTSWMLQNDLFQHNEAGADPGAQMRAAGYPFAGSWTWGQNIGFRGTTLTAPPLVPTTRQLEQDLFVDANEPGRGHRVNILNPTFKEIGIGIASGPLQGYNSVLASQDFAAQSGNSFLTGVAYNDAVVADHFYEPGEGLGGVNITAVRDSDHASFATTTWSSGGYSLGLAPGTYAVTATGAGLGRVVINSVTIGSQNVKVDFTPDQAAPPAPPSHPTSTSSGWLLGTIFRDRNGNGIQDSGETGFAHWRVFADLSGDGRWRRGDPFVWTNRRGNFALSLPAGTYTLREAIPGRFICTTAPGGAMRVTVIAGQSLSNLRFGDRFAPPPKKLHRGLFDH